MKTFNSIKIILFSLFLLTSLISCKDDSSFVSIEGEWEGGLKSINTPNLFFLAFNIKPNQILEFTLLHDTGPGTWSLNGDDFVAKFNIPENPELTFIAQFNYKTGELMNGTWKPTGSVDVAGNTWFMKKK